MNELLHKEAIEHDRRADGRPMDKVRDIYVQAGGLSDVVHGSGVFYRGGTHVLSVATLGGPDDSLILNSIEAPDTKKDICTTTTFLRSRRGRLVVWAGRTAA